MSKLWLVKGCPRMDSPSLPTNYNSPHKQVVTQIIPQIVAPKLLIKRWVPSSVWDFDHSGTPSWWGTFPKVKNCIKYQKKLRGKSGVKKRETICLQKAAQINTLLWEKTKQLSKKKQKKPSISHGVWRLFTSLSSCNVTHKALGLNSQCSMYKFISVLTHY